MKHVSRNAPQVLGEQTTLTETNTLPYGLKVEDYWHYMDEWEITDERKLEWLVQLVHLVKGFVDLGAGQDTVQSVLAKRFADRAIGTSKTGDKLISDSAQTAPNSATMLEHTHATPRTAPYLISDRKAGRDG